MPEGFDHLFAPDYAERARLQVVWADPRETAATVSVALENDPVLPQLPFQLCSHMGVDAAAAAMLGGALVRRRAWHEGAYLGVSATGREPRWVFASHTAFYLDQPWCPSMQDLTADDWEAYQGSASREWM